MTYVPVSLFGLRLVMPSQADHDEGASSETGVFRPAATPREEIVALDRGMRHTRERATLIFQTQREAIAAARSVAVNDHVEIVVVASNDEQMCAAVRTESLPDKHFDIDLNVSLSGLDAYEATTLKRLLTENIRAFLTAARQENAQQRIMKLVQAIAPEDPLAEIDLKAAEATVELRKEFFERVPVLTSSEVHKNAGFPQGNASQTVLRWRKAGKIFGINHGGRDLYPAFQFGPDGRPLPTIADVLTILRRATDASDWDTALWFAGDTGWLAGKTPIDCLQSDPESVKRAAEQEVLRDEY